MSRFVARALVVAWTGCASVPPDAGHREVAEAIAARTGAATGWAKGAPEDERVSRRIDDLLRGGLRRDRAVEIALMNNPRLQATYEELGVSQADLVQAGLLANPTLAGSVGFPSNGARLEYESSLVLGFLDVLVLPLRKRVAKEQLIADTLRVSHEALGVAADVRKAFAEVQAATKVLELRRMVVEGAQATADLARRQHRAGNINDLVLATEEATYQQAKLELAQAETGLVEHLEEMNRLLGLWGRRTDWTLAEPLGELPAEEVPLDRLEATAVKQRLDIDAARKQALLMWNAVELARSSRFFGLVQVGVHVHQDPDGPRLLGPTLSLELPIFDRRQALVARLEAQRRSAERRLQAVSIEARSQVRVARVKLMTARQVAEHYRKILLPLRERIVAQTQLQYNAMQLGLFELVAAKSAQIEAFRAYIESLRDYWISRAELERAMGGRIGAHAQAR